MAYPIKGCTEINLHDPSLLPTLQCTLQCMGHAQTCITGPLTFPISKHTTAFHKSSQTNWHLTLKHLRQYWCFGNRSVIGKRGGRWTLRNRGDISLSPASQQTTQTNKPPKNYTKMRGRTSVVLRKRGNMPKVPFASIRVKVKQVTPDLTRPEGRGGKTRRRMEREQQINTLQDCVLSKWFNSSSALPTDSHTSAPPSLTSEGNDELEPNRCSFKTSTGLSASQMLRQGRSCIEPQTVFQLTRCKRKIFLLTNKFGTAWAFEMTADLDRGVI